MITDRLFTILNLLYKKKIKPKEGYSAICGYVIHHLSKENCSNKYKDIDEILEFWRKKVGNSSCVNEIVNNLEPL